MAVQKNIINKNFILLLSYYPMSAILNEYLIVKVKYLSRRFASLLIAFYTGQTM